VGVISHNEKRAAGKTEILAFMEVKKVFSCPCPFTPEER
jgi:hypothetical protein